MECLLNGAIDEDTCCWGYMMMTDEFAGDACLECSMYGRVHHCVRLRRGGGMRAQVCYSVDEAEVEQQWRRALLTTRAASSHRFSSLPLSISPSYYPYVHK